LFSTQQRLAAEGALWACSAADNKPVAEDPPTAPAAAKRRLLCTVVSYTTTFSRRRRAQGVFSTRQQPRSRRSTERACG
jgi:hypothetical protein